MILDEFIDRISGRWSASLRGWIYLSSIGMLGTVTRLTTLHEITFLEALSISLAVILISSPIYFLMTITLLKDRKTQNIPLERIFFFYIIIWLTVSMSEIGLTHFVLNKTAYLGPQLFATLFPDIFGFAATSYLLSEFDANRKDIGRLLFAQKELLRVTKETQEKVFEDRSNLIEAIQDRIFFQLDSMKREVSALSSTINRRRIETLANKLEQFSVNSIRSLSHEMVEDSENREKIDRSLFVGSQLIKNFTNLYAPIISMRISLLVLVIVGGFNQLSLNGIRGLEFQILSSLSILPILFAGSIVTRRVSPGNPRVGFIYFLFFIFATGYVSVITSNYILNNLIELRNPYSATVFAGRAITTVIFASLIVTIVEARRKTLRELVMMNDKLQSDIEVFDNRSSEIKRDLSAILHGPLQGRIAGIALALRIHSKDESLTNSERELRMQEIQNLLESVISDVREQFSIDSDTRTESIIIKLIEMRKSWSGIADISWRIDPRAFHLIEKISRKDLVNILYESISNSVRHGKANQVRIEIGSKDDNLVVKIKDNGKGLDSTFVPSMGLNAIKLAGGDYFFENSVSSGAELNIRFSL